MKPIVNTKTIISARRFLIEELEKIGLDNLNIYSLVFPSKKLPDSFIVIKPIGGLDDIGNIDVRGSIEFCIYAKNLGKADDQTQPNLEVISDLSEKILPILNDAVFDNIAITAIRQQIVNHSEIRYYYNSFVCQTINLKTE